MAYAAGKVGTHAKIKVRLPKHRCLRDDWDDNETGFGKIDRHHRRPRDFQHGAAQGHAVLQHRAAVDHNWPA